MFDRRLKILLAVLGLGLLAIVGRLGQLQIVQAGYYRERAERAILLRPTQLPFVRGRILDRTGEILVSNIPSWNLTIDFGVLAAEVRNEPPILKRYVRRLKRAGRYPDATTDAEIEQTLRQKLAAMWHEIARFASRREPVSVDDLRSRAKDIYAHITRIRKVVAARRGFDAPVAEETVPHAILTDLDADQQIAARELYEWVPWVHVEPSSVRHFAGDATPFAHVLGRLGRVDASHVANDPNSDDPFAKYRADERVGIMGVEFVAEQVLRGRRGQITKDRDGDLVTAESIEAEDGRDVTLTLHAGLQRRLYRLLADTVDGIPESPGGVIVVLDVPSREVLALVSYPSYDPNHFNELYVTLRDETDRLPLRFRAVANRYAPGSLVKPLVCLAGLMNARLTLDIQEECTGFLFPEHRDRWRCWRIHGTNRRKAHGSVDLVGALTGSCNVFMYRLGERVGVDRLCSTFDMVGIGKRPGIGLREEAAGINPTPGWLMAHKNIRITPGVARYLAIGQGELSMTPVQVANLMAVYASGRYRPLTLIKGASPTPEWTLPVSPEQWSAIRRGIFGVANDPGGTAYKYAHFEQDGFALSGKTGSATARPWPTSYRVRYEDEKGTAHEAIVPAGARSGAIERFASQYPRATFDPAKVEVASRWPPYPAPGGEEYSHAWFAGYLQALDSVGQPDWSREPRLAFAVLVEFGGSGSRTSGPLARRVAATLLETIDYDLDGGVGTATGVIR